MKPAYNPDLFFDWVEIPVRYRDLDPLNHVNNAIFSSYYEEARIHFIQQIPVLSEELKKSRSFVIVNLNINFLKQLCSTARATGVWFDLEKQRPAPLPKTVNMDQLLVD